MRRKPGTLVDHEVQLARLAWWAAFLATLALVAVLGIARSAQAATFPAQSLALTNPTAFDEEDEAGASEDEGFEWDECGEEEECEDEDGDGAMAPSECLLLKADATVFAAGNQDLVRLQLRYDTAAPTNVSVAYGLHGSKGSLYLGNEKKHFGKHGVLRLSKDLTEAQMTKVMAAKDFTVRMRVADAPGYCAPFFDRHLDIPPGDPQRARLATVRIALSPAAPRRARRSRPPGARDRSGGRARTRDR